MSVGMVLLCAATGDAVAVVVSGDIVGKCSEQAAKKG